MKPDLAPVTGRQGTTLPQHLQHLTAYSGRAPATSLSAGRRVRPLKFDSLPGPSPLENVAECPCFNDTPLDLLSGDLNGRR